MHRKKTAQKYLLISFIALQNVFGQHNYQTDFPAEEFKQRWESVFNEIGDNAVAVVQGFSQPTGYIMPRLTNAFYFLTGVETPHSYLLLDGRTKKVTLYMPPANKKLEKSEGKVIIAEDGQLLTKLVGVVKVESTNEMKENFPPHLKRNNIIYTYVGKYTNL